MVKLSEDMIVARTRVSDMNHVKKLNCWGAELEDISVIRKLSNVEVLSLSVNAISTLSDIQFCRNLQELYIRKNQIPDISEICWLRDLPRLKNLWLEENPCAEGSPELYRMTVIKNLPHLQKLDNVAVTPEEMAEAMRHGLDLEHPMDGGSNNQTARLQPAGQRQEQRGQEREDSLEPQGRRSSRGHAQEPQQQPERRESVMSPSRKVSSQGFEGNHPYLGQQSTSRTSMNWDEDGYVEQHQSEYARRYSTSSHNQQQYYSHEEVGRRPSSREEHRYQVEEVSRPQRHSYCEAGSGSGGALGQQQHSRPGSSTDYTRHQHPDTIRSPQQPQASSRASTPSSQHSDPEQGSHTILTQP